MPGRDHRQLHLDRPGRPDRRAHRRRVHRLVRASRRRGFSVAGNMLAGPRVLDDTAAAFEANRALPFALRLIVAMEAGEAAGGDKRGKQAAALIVCTTETLSGARPARRRPPRADRRIAAPVREEPRALPAVRRLPAPPRRSGRHHRPRRHRSRDRALPGGARAPARSRLNAAAACAILNRGRRFAGGTEHAASHPREDSPCRPDIGPFESDSRWRWPRALTRGRAGADAAHRPRRGPRRARSDARAHVRRAHRLRGAVRQAVRHRREARHRARSSRRRTSGRRTARR